MKNKKRIIILVCIMIGVIVLALATSYALFTFNVTKNSNFKVAIGTLELSITDTTTEDKFIMESTVPTKDEVALTQDGYNFTINNTGTLDSYYTVYLDDIILSDSGERLDNSYVKVNLLNNKTNQSTTRYLSDYEETNRILTTGMVKAKENVSYTLRMWVDYNAGNEAQNKYFATQIRVVGTQTNAVAYEESILNGATPVLSKNLVPIQIADDGTVTKADINTEWYSYENKRWANAVILKENKTYANNQIIPEDNIESYFVWIPKYSYQLWDLGDYSSLTNLDTNKKHPIPIKFGTSDTTDSVAGECTTPMSEDGTQGLAGESGNCQVGDYMTHPAFLSFDSDGLWVGKFETGYDGATSKEEAQIDSNDSNKVIIKPNVYSWRSATLGNMFKVSYDYLRNDESHMMKNTEWGAVAYLYHSMYGSQSSLRINNNGNTITGYAALEETTKGYNSGTSIDGNRIEGTSLGIDGTYTVNYLNSNSVVASTTGNITGIYDMSGGVYEYVASYTTGATTVGGSSGITSIYSDFFTNSNWNKYYDVYLSKLKTDYNNRILGDATGEIGPFGTIVDPDKDTRNISSWYGDYAHFTHSSSPWLDRGGNFTHGTGAGIFTFGNSSGTTSTNIGFRIVLTPTK